MITMLFGERQFLPNGTEGWFLLVGPGGAVIEAGSFDFAYGRNNNGYRSMINGYRETVGVRPDTGPENHPSKWDFHGTGICPSRWDPANRRRWYEILLKHIGAVPDGSGAREWWAAVEAAKEEMKQPSPN